MEYAVVPKCPKCKEHLWFTGIKYDRIQTDSVKRWYQYSSHAKFCSKCNTRLRENVKLSTGYIFCLVFFFPYYNNFLAPKVVKEFGVAVNIGLLLLITFFTLWLIWFGQKYEIYEDDKKS